MLAGERLNLARQLRIDSRNQTARPKPMVRGDPTFTR